MDLRKILADSILKSAPEDGLNETGVTGVRCLKFSKPSERFKGEWPRSFVVVAQGSKEIQLEGSCYQYAAPHFIATPIALQVTSRVKHASAETPYLALLIGFDPLELTDVAHHMVFDPLEKSKARSHGLFAGRASTAMMESSIRLAKLCASPEEAKVFAPLVLREMYYHLLRSKSGLGIQRFTQSGSKMQKIAQAINALKSDLASTTAVQELAERVGLSRSSFFRAFSEITAMSPIQYQKRLRLNEARRLLIDEKETAESAAYAVGYKSASQFSREYSRMFGNSPIRDVEEFLERRAKVDRF